MPPTSNDQGRSFEYAVFKQLMIKFPQASVTPQAENAQTRDEDKFLPLSSELQAQFQSAGRHIAERTDSCNFSLI